MGVLSKDKRDIYYKLAKENGFRARSAYKIIQIDEHYNILKENAIVIDLCAAPGSWTQVVAEKCKKVIAVDIQEIVPLENVKFIKDDITNDSCMESVLEAIRTFNNNDMYADIVLCDGAADTNDRLDLDVYIQHNILLAALKMAEKILKVGTTFVGKFYRDGDTQRIIKKFMEVFGEVDLVKPRCSRSKSIECFIVAKKKRESKIMLDRHFNLALECFAVGKGPDPDVSTNNMETSPIKHKFPPRSPPYKKAIEERRRK